MNYDNTKMIRVFETASSILNELDMERIYKDVTTNGKKLGTDKKFNRHWYEYKGQLWVHSDGSKSMTNNGSVDVPMNKKIIAGLVREETEIEVTEQFKVGDKVRVPHKGKMVSGKIVRFDSGGTDKARQHGGGYVVDVGEPASILVPKQNVRKEEVEHIDEAKVKYLTGPGKKDSKRLIGIYTMGGKWVKDMNSEREAAAFVNKSWGEKEEVGVTEALRGMGDVKSTSGEWRKGRLKSSLTVERSGGRVEKLRAGDEIFIHPFDGERHVGATDKKDEGGYFFVAKYRIA